MRDQPRKRDELPTSDAPRAHMPTPQTFRRIFHLHEHLMVRTRWYPITVAFALIWATAMITKSAL